MRRLVLDKTIQDRSWSVAKQKRNRYKFVLDETRKEANNDSCFYSWDPCARTECSLCLEHWMSACRNWYLIRPPPRHPAICTRPCETWRHQTSTNLTLIGLMQNLPALSSTFSLAYICGYHLFINITWRFYRIDVHPRRTCILLQTRPFNAHGRPQEFFQRGGTPWTDEIIYFSARPRRKRKFSRFFRRFRLNLTVFDASAYGATDNFRVVSTGTAYDVIIFKFQGGATMSTSSALYCKRWRVFYTV